MQQQGNIRVDLTKVEERQRAVQYGYIWNAPRGAVEAALKDIAAGKYPPPEYIPSDFVGLADQYGVHAPVRTPDGRETP